MDMAFTIWFFFGHQLDPAPPDSCAEIFRWIWRRIWVRAQYDFPPRPSIELGVAVRQDSRLLELRWKQMALGFGGNAFGFFYFSFLDSFLVLLAVQPWALKNIVWIKILFFSPKNPFVFLFSRKRLFRKHAQTFFQKFFSSSLTTLWSQNLTSNPWKPESFFREKKLKTLFPVFFFCKIF